MSSIRYRSAGTVTVWVKKRQQQLNRGEGGDGTFRRGDPSATRTRWQHRNDGCECLLVDAVHVGNHHRKVIAVGLCHDLGDEKRGVANVSARITRTVLPGLRTARPPAPAGPSASLLAFEHTHSGLDNIAAPADSCAAMSCYVRRGQECAARPIGRVQNGARRLDRHMHMENDVSPATRIVTAWATTVILAAPTRQHRQRMPRGRGVKQIRGVFEQSDLIIGVESPAQVAVHQQHVTADREHTEWETAAPACDTPPEARSHSRGPTPSSGPRSGCPGSCTRRATMIGFERLAQQVRLTTPMSLRVIGSRIGDPAQASSPSDST